MLRDRLVLVCSMETRKRLLQIDPLTLKTVQDTLAVFEAIEVAKGGLLQRNDSSGELHFIKRKSQ